MSEELKAEEFRQCYFAGVPVDLFYIQSAAYICGMGLKSLPKEKFPNRMRGYNDIDDKGRRTIYYAQHDAVSGIQNTILHDLREIMEKVLAEVDPSYQPLDRDACHIAANRFATAVLLPQTDFLAQVYQTGLDVIALSQIFQKSCSQILLRMGEVLKEKLPFCGALYEPLAERPEQWVVSYSVSTANHPQHYLGWLKSDGFLLPKGQTMKPGSVADRALQRQILSDPLSPDSGTNCSGHLVDSRPAAGAGRPGI